EHLRLPGCQIEDDDARSRLGRVLDERDVPSGRRYAHVAEPPVGPIDHGSGGQLDLLLTIDPPQDTEITAIWRPVGFLYILDQLPGCHSAERYHGQCAPEDVPV